MPLTTSSPVAYREANIWEVVGFVASLPRRAGEPPSMQLQLAVGYNDGETTTWHETREIGVEPPALIAIMSQPQRAGLSLYAALRLAMYTYLKQAGHIPEEASDPV
jgi:hypothetical protein